jgi:predicted acetyltransferase
MASTLQLIWPAAERLPSYIAALERGWSPVTGRPEARLEDLERVARDPVAFLALLVDREGAGPPIKLPDESFVPRLPGFRKWMWDGEFSGSISLRWQPGTTDLPPHCLGHIGYSVVPWKRGLGYATRALGLLLPDARDLGLPFVEITTEEENVASQRVITSNGGELVERFTAPASHGGAPMLRYRIRLT